MLGFRRQGKKIWGPGDRAASSARYRAQLDSAATAQERSV